MSSDQESGDIWESAKEKISHVREAVMENIIPLIPSQAAEVTKREIGETMEHTGKTHESPANVAETAERPENWDQVDPVNGEYIKDAADRLCQDGSDLAEASGIFSW